MKGARNGRLLRVPAACPLLSAALDAGLADRSVAPVEVVDRAMEASYLTWALFMMCCVLAAALSGICEVLWKCS